MNKLIYYPGFEAKSENWLKFALLYIGELNPIIPWSGDKFLSPDFRKLLGESDLINIYRPEYSDGEEATFIASDAVERIMRDPQSYSRIFRNNNIISTWKNPLTHDYTLFEEKYTHSWENFCMKNGFGTRTDLGLRISEDLGFVYMTILAQVIADRNSVSPITDHRNFDRFATFSRIPSKLEQERIKAVQGVIQLQLPANISQIPLEQILKLRKKRGFKEQLFAFHTELNKYWQNIENNSWIGNSLSLSTKIGLILLPI